MLDWPAMQAQKQQARPAAALYVVATPIGNLEDITLRALRILKEVDLIACEDTRQTQKLLNHYGISTPTTSYHEHNEMTRSGELVMQLEEGRSIALVSDAGTPNISDPGYRLIALAIQRHIPVVPIPGASAFVAALAASGLPTDSFHFAGFLPAKAGQRRQIFEQIVNSLQTEIFYEAPHRLQEAMSDAADILGRDRHIVIAREVTKLHEEFIRGRAGELAAELKNREVRGEITLLIGKAEAQSTAAAPGPRNLRVRLEQIMAEQKLDEKSALKILAKEMGVSKSEAYRELQRQRSS